MKLVGLKPVVILSLGLLLVQSSAWSMTIQIGAGGAELIKRGDQWRFFRGVTAPSTPADAWRGIDFGDSGWELDESGFGYGDGDDETILDNMQNNYWTVYIRKQFTVSPVPTGQVLELLIDYDDGFVAYLNGNRVEYQHIRDQDVDGINYQTPATSHEANHQTGQLDVFPLGLAEDFLKDGKNVLAIEGHNATLDSTDFSLIPALRTRSSTVKNDNTWIMMTNTISLTVTTSAPGVVSVTTDGAPADYNSVDQTWEGQASVSPGLNTIVVEALDAGAGVVDSGTAEVIYVPAQNVFAGQLPENATWSGHVIIKDDLVVPAGVVLTIEPGTVVLIADGVIVTVNGRVLANGTDAEPIQFTHYGDDTAWGRIMFINAEDSRLAHCIIEYADCEGDHKDYYDNDCDDETPPLPRTYHEAVVSLASHLDIEACVFQNLPASSGSKEGDAIAIVSDDPQFPGEASANVLNCRFLSIGAGVHTRYSYVLVEDCFFTDHHGDNDDVDLYGESTPVPMIRNNLFLDSKDDYINPTRCSAIFIGNVVIGGDQTDSGVVLRDRCSPVMINNLIYNCNSAGIAVQNQCDALLINNTIVDCGAGIKFWDHTERWVHPYCLYPGSGKATVINCIIWDCPTSFDLDDSPYTGDLGSHATVLYCDVEGGQGTASVSTNSTLVWGAGNINIDPQFASTSSHDLHLKSQAGRWNPATESWVTDGVTSPCIDAGTSYLVDDPKYRYSGLIDWRGELWPHGAKINMGAYGGTAQASMSSDSGKGNVADVDYDGSVGLSDYARLAQWWRMERTLLAEDLDRNGVVDFRDVLLMGQEWTWQEEP
jgi:hypothetical protein